MVAFEVSALMAPVDIAFTAAHDERGHDLGWDVPADVRNGEDVLALRHDRGHERRPK